MDIERLRQAVIDKRFILSANPDWREGRSCGLTDDKTEKKANDALTIILENIAELVVAYLIGARHPVKSEDVQEAIEQLMYGSWQSYKDGYPIKLGDKIINLAIAALQKHQPWVEGDATDHINCCPNCGWRWRQRYET